MIELEKGNMVYKANKDSDFYEELVDKGFKPVKKAKQKKVEDPPKENQDDKPEEGDK